MRLRKVLGSLTATGVLVGAFVFLPNCSTVAALASPCDPAALDASASTTEAAVKAFYDSATVVAAKLVAVNQMYGTACNAMMPAMIQTPVLAQRNAFRSVVSDRSGLRFGSADSSRARNPSVTEPT